MSLDLKWFMSVPGICLTVGVIFLLIALIMLIRSSLKAKKLSKEENMDMNVNASPEMVGVASVNSDVPIMDASGNMVQPNVDMNMPNMGTNQNVNTNLDANINAPVVDPSVVSSTVSPSVNIPANNGIDLSNNVSDFNQANVNITPPQLDSANVDVTIPQTNMETSIQPDINTNNIDNNLNQNINIPPVNIPQADVNINQPVEVDMSANLNQVPQVNNDPNLVNVNMNEPMPNPIIDNIEVSSPPVEVIPQVEAVQAPSIVSVNPQPNVNPVNNIENNNGPVIYGGANPVVSDVNIEPAVSNPQIYGGADPLTNTQSVPIVDTLDSLPQQINQAPTTPQTNQQQTENVIPNIVN